MTRFNQKLTPFFALATLAFVCQSALAQSVDFVEPKNGQTVSSPFKVAFTVSGMSVAPAGDLTKDTGHHHLLINASAIPEGTIIPADETHMHFGKGQTETQVTLAPGRYKLQMQFANGVHQSYGEKMSKTIEITVK
jgi:Domain of unknown function (DUF4399)